MDASWKETLKWFLWPLNATAPSSSLLSCCWGQQFCHRATISYGMPQNYFPSGHAPPLFRDKNPESDNASPCQLLHQSPNSNNQTVPSNQSYCFPPLHQPMLLPRARRASLFPTSCHSNWTGFSQSLDISWIACKKLLLHFSSINPAAPGPTSLMLLHWLWVNYSLNDNCATPWQWLYALRSYIFLDGRKEMINLFEAAVCPIAAEINWAGRVQCKLDSMYYS